MRSGTNRSKTIIEGGRLYHVEPAGQRLMKFLCDNKGRVCLRDECIAAMGSHGNRSLDTMIAHLRKALSSEQEENLITIPCKGYLWIGDQIRFGVARSEFRPTPTVNRFQFSAAKTQVEVAKILGITHSAVSLIERKALRKLRKKPELKAAWRALISTHKRVAYDPFYEMWLFGVQEQIANNPIGDDDATDNDR